ncbi:MAG: autotransporter outer membrane beta-barrel domain-containing protein [Parachlamydiales bacterium]|nr:autotransporter outer membrane beta-barrel domain-containing protein [Parachlamydiales bacterium]
MRRLLFVLAIECMHAVTVTSNADSGPGTLRYVIEQFNGTLPPMPPPPPIPPPMSQIDFNIAGPSTITLLSPLPILNAANSNLIGIDGFNGGNPVIVDGGGLYPGLVINDLDLTATPAFMLQNITFQNCLALGANGMGAGIPGDPGWGGSLLTFFTPPPPPPAFQFVIQDVQFLNSKAQGGDGNQNQGGFAWGGVSLTGFPFTVQGSAVFNGTLQPGNPPPPPNINLGWTIFSPNSDSVTEFNPTLVSDTISFTDAFLIGGPLVQNGPGTVSLSTTSTAPPSGDFPPSVYYVMKDTTIQQGTFHLDGQVIQTPDGVLLPLPVFGSIGDLTFMSGTTLSGNGLIFAGDGKTAYYQGSTIAPSPGILLLLGETQFQTGTKIMTSVQPTQAASVMMANFVIPAPARNIQGATLYVDVVPGSYTAPTVYALVLSQEIFDGRFQDIVVTGSFGATFGLGNPLDPPTVIYSPLSAPNSVLMPVNVPFGISTANIVLGTITLQSTVLYDPCAGIIVISLLAPGQGAAALSQFFANQTVLSAQTLGSLTASINANCLKKSEAKAAPASGPVAAWYQQKNQLLAQSSEEAAPPIPQPIRELDDTQKPQEGEKHLLPSLFSQKKQTPNYSISLTPFAQFQNQGQVVTSNAVVPAYDTQSYGAILGFDYIGLETILIGGAASFAWTDLNVAENGGGQKTWSGFGTAYSSFTFGHFFFNVLATGSYNHNTAARIFSPIEGETITIESTTPLGVKSVYTFQGVGVPGGTSFSKYNVYQVVPHVDFNYEFGFGSLSLVPFFLSDCSISFAESITETGDNFLNPNACANKISLNTATDSLVTTIIQSETGANFFEQFDFKKKGILIYRLKASYVNRYTVPYTLRSKLVDSIDFTKTSMHLPMQHMFGYAAEAIYRWRRFSTVLTYQGMVGSGYLSNAAYLRFAYDF